MTTVRDILADNPNGISRPGLLAWSRLRIDPELTDAQLEDEVALLGDEVIEREGFLYLRDAVGSAAVESDAAGSWDAGAAWPQMGAVEPGTVGRGAESTGWTPPDAEEGVPAGWTAPGDGAGRTTRRLIGIVAAVVGIALFLLGILGSVTEDSRTGDAGGGAGDAGGTVIDPDRLGVGDCFDVPPAGEFDEILVMSCDSVHGGEVFLVADYEGDPGGFPSDAMFERWVEVNCDPAFAEYTGSDWYEQDLLDIGWFMPVEAGWAQGDRGMVCWLGHADGSQATVSYRGANP